MSFKKFVSRSFLPIATAGTLLLFPMPSSAVDVSQKDIFFQLFGSQTKHLFHNDVYNKTKEICGSIGGCNNAQFSEIHSVVEKHNREFVGEVFNVIKYSVDSCTKVKDERLVLIGPDAFYEISYAKGKNTRNDPILFNADFYWQNHELKLSWSDSFPFGQFNLGDKLDYSYAVMVNDGSGKMVSGSGSITSPKNLDVEVRQSLELEEALVLGGFAESFNNCVPDKR